MIGAMQKTSAPPKPRAAAEALIAGFSQGLGPAGSFAWHRSELAWRNAGRMAGAQMAPKLAKGLEHDEQVAVFRLLSALEPLDPIRIGSIFAVPNGGLRHKAVAGKLKAEGVKPGVPDICLPFPSQCFHSAYVEMKAVKNGSVSADQKLFHTALIANGNRCLVCRGWEEAINAITHHLWPIE